MGLTSFFNRSKQSNGESGKDRYWSLLTNEGEVVDPTWEQTKLAVKNATPTGNVFAKLGYQNSGLDIESIQAFSEAGLYRLEALPPKQGKIYVKDGLTHAEALKIFESFYHEKEVIGYRDWQTEKNK